MFKFLGKAFALLVLSIFFISSAQARDYKEGLDYEIRATNKTVEPEIREFFHSFVHTVLQWKSLSLKWQSSSRVRQSSLLIL